MCNLECFIFFIFVFLFLGVVLCVVRFVSRRRARRRWCVFRFCCLCGYCLLCVVFFIVCVCWLLCLLCVFRVFFVLLCCFWSVFLCCCCVFVLCVVCLVLCLCEILCVCFVVWVMLVIGCVCWMDVLWVIFVWSGWLWLLRCCILWVVRWICLCTTCSLSNRSRAASRDWLLGVLWVRDSWCCGMNILCWLYIWCSGMVGRWRWLEILGVIRRERRCTRRSRVSRSEWTWVCKLICIMERCCEWVFWNILRWWWILGWWLCIMCWWEWVKILCRI